MTYIGVIASAVLHVGGLFLLLTARAPDPLIPLGSDTPVAIDIISVDEYNALISKAPSQSTLAALRVQPDAPRAPVIADVDPIVDTLEAETPPPDAPDASTDLVMRLPPAVLDIPPETDELPPPEAPDVAVAPAPKPPLLDADALQDRGVDPADLGPPDDVRVAIAPPAPKPPRGAFDALPEIDTSPDEPPKPSETEGQGEEVQPAPEPALAEPVETAQADDPAPLATPLPIPKPRGSLTVASDETLEPSPPAPVAQPVEPQPETPAVSQLSEAELEEERQLMAALMEQMRAELPPSDAELRAAEEEARRKFAEEQQRLADLAALDEAERRKREAEDRAKAAAAAAEADRLARQQAEARERELADLRAREAEQRRAQQEALEARRRADIEAQRLAQEQLDRQRREAARREQEARDLAARRQQLAELNATTAPENRANNVLESTAPPAARQPDSFLGGDQALASILGAAANAAQSATTGPSFGQGSSGARGASLTPGETQAVLNQLRRCWRVDTFSANARNLVVTFRAEIRQNGFVNQGTISLMSPNPVPPEYQIAVDRARTALQDLRCQPFSLPPQKFNAWRDIVIRFDPAQMVLQ